MTSLRSALKAAEDLGTISSINISNAYTLGYKALNGEFAPNCSCQDLDSPESFQEIYLKISRNQKQGDSVEINGKKYENSNVDSIQELKNLVTSANMTRSTLAGIQVENAIQKEIINLSSS